MSFQRFTQRWRYSWKEYLAVFFAAAAFAFALSDVICNIILYASSSSREALSLITPILNFLVMAYIYAMLLSGNLRGTANAFFGLLNFMLVILIDIAFNLVVLGFFDFGVIFGESSDPVTIAWVIGILVAYVAVLVVGIFAYVRFRQYISNRYSNTTAVIALVCVFLGILVLYEAVFVGACFAMGYGEGAAWLVLLDPIGILCGALSSLFTVLRLRD